MKYKVPDVGTMVWDETSDRIMEFDGEKWNAVEETPVVVSHGYSVELSRKGAWLMLDSSATTNWNRRGIWHKKELAESALARRMERLGK